MARLARASLVGYPHQVTQRGNYEQRVFEEDADYRRYLELVKENSDRYGIDIWAYCLMPNHVHFICVPKTDGGLARGFNSLHMRYAQYFHAKKGLTGHLWRARFQSCMLDEPSVLEEIRFIENDPVRDGIVARAEDYPWSSARHHILEYLDPLISRGDILKDGEVNWPAYLIGSGDYRVLSNTWKCLKTGRPAGDVEWVHKIEMLTGRLLIAQPRGRPRKRDSKVFPFQLLPRTLRNR